MPQSPLLHGRRQAQDCAAAVEWMRITGDVARSPEAMDDAGGAAGRELQPGSKLPGFQFARACEVLDREHLGFSEAESSG